MTRNTPKRKKEPRIPPVKSQRGFKRKIAKAALPEMVALINAKQKPEHLHAAARKRLNDGVL